MTEPTRHDYVDREDVWTAVCDWWTTADEDGIDVLMSLRTRLDDLPVRASVVDPTETTPSRISFAPEPIRRLTPEQLDNIAKWTSAEPYSETSQALRQAAHDARVIEGLKAYLRSQIDHWSEQVMRAPIGGDIRRVYDARYNKSCEVLSELTRLESLP